ncbi:MAG: tRNA (N(6)-L-threonylcarbamoyladenosine(37)-C(2))-methylthiotransferase MtaB [Oscillospiraceae bacterium]|jgi:threonylcarbamoyladenosine tRNA methylthiotransferase MtaB|nr:tRNA (N(6)-L-threonylcarbamoyladenosine(37)-C(2))-methylthiotransferase MtaB [Oscillospiraceae bacterium]
MKVGFFTLGCKVNQYETECLSQKLREVGFEIANKGEEADIFVIGSCTVTAVSDRKTRQMINRARDYGADFVVLMGCFVDVFREAAAKLKVDLILSNAEKMKLPELLKERFKLQLKDATEVSVVPQRKAKAFVKIQSGCNRACSYCIIPKARGKSYSKSLVELQKEVALVAAVGFEEVVLVGINLLLFGKDIGCELIDAVELTCCNEKIQRVSLSSLNPEVITNKMLCRLTLLRKFCPHFHISLQSGSNNILKKMNRSYTVEMYEKIVDNVRNYFEDPSITTDIIVGFPGETEADFYDSLEFVKKMKFAKAHIFPYSKRPGTVAATMEGQVPDKEKERRFKEMQLVVEANQMEFNLKMVGKRVCVLLENKCKNGFFKGYAANYVKVLVKSDEDLKYRFLNVRITTVQSSGCVGVIE